MERISTIWVDSKIFMEKNKSLTFSQLWHKAKNLFSNETKAENLSVEVTGEVIHQPRAYIGQGQATRLFSVSYDGEKNLGEIGPVKNYLLDYNILRLRAWQSYLESELTPTIIDKFNLWLVGSGLKLQSQPNQLIIGKGFDSESFNEITEARWNIFSESKLSDFSGNLSLNQMQKEALKNIFNGGDILVILRYIDNFVKVQIIDGGHVQYFTGNNDFYTTATSKGNRIINGIEVDSTGKHVAYYVKKSFSESSSLGYERIPAYGAETGLRVAYLVYGKKHRLDNLRGIPKMTTSLETLKKLERYKEAVVGSAEERQKIVYQIVHQNFSTGESPLMKQMANAHNFLTSENDQLPQDVNGTELANTVAATTNKQTYNMPLGSEMKALESKNELYFKEFYETNVNIICASLGIPPNVAMSMYNDSFSASRAALKDWEHTLNVNRKDFADQFLKPIYDFWLHTEILKGNIIATGYLKAFVKRDFITISAYTHCYFVGANVPHIDPLKEVKAEREKLGPLGANLPLTTAEQATRNLNGGDVNENMAQYSKELERSYRLKLKEDKEDKEEDQPSS